MAGIEQRFVPADALRERKFQLWRRCYERRPAPIEPSCSAGKSARVGACATPARVGRGIDQGESRRGEDGRGDGDVPMFAIDRTDVRRGGTARGLHAGREIARWTRSPPARVACWWPRTSPRADSICRTCATSSTLTSPRTRATSTRAPSDAPDARVVEDSPPVSTFRGSAGETDPSRRADRTRRRQGSARRVVRGVAG